jgi:hypothetical protein
MPFPRVVGAKRIAIPDRGVLPPPETPPPPSMFWVSLTVEIGFTDFAITPKNDPVVIGPVEGKVRLRNTVASVVIETSVFSDDLGPGVGNQPTGLQARLTGLVYGQTNKIEIKVNPTNPLLGTATDWTTLLEFTPFPGGPFDIPLIES